MRRVFHYTLGSVAGAMLAFTSVVADDLELAAHRDADSATRIQVELDRAGFYAGEENGSDEDRMIEAIADFEHFIGWPETGEATPELLGALQEYNARRSDSELDF